MTVDANLIEGFKLGFAVGSVVGCVLGVLICLFVIQKHPGEKWEANGR